MSLTTLSPIFSALRSIATRAGIGDLKKVVDVRDALLAYEHKFNPSDEGFGIGQYLSQILNDQGKVHQKDWSMILQHISAQTSRNWEGYAPSRSVHSARDEAEVKLAWWCYFDAILHVFQDYLYVNSRWPGQIFDLNHIRDATDIQLQRLRPKISRLIKSKNGIIMTSPCVIKTLLINELKPLRFFSDKEAEDIINSAIYSTRRYLINSKRHYGNDQNNHDPIITLTLFHFRNKLLTLIEDAYAHRSIWAMIQKLWRRKRVGRPTRPVLRGA